VLQEALYEGGKITQGRALGDFFHVVVRIVESGHTRAVALQIVNRNVKLVREPLGNHSDASAIYLSSIPTGHQHHSRMN
jgi:hypothetical protein